MAKYDEYDDEYDNYDDYDDDDSDLNADDMPRESEHLTSDELDKDPRVAKIYVPQKTLTDIIDIIDFADETFKHLAKLAEQDNQPGVKDQMYNKSIFCRQLSEGLRMYQKPVGEEFTKGMDEAIQEMADYVAANKLLH